MREARRGVLLTVFVVFDLALVAWWGLGCVPSVAVTAVPL